MQLLFKRAKIFMLEKDNQNLRFSSGPGGPVPTPSWVVETGTYKNGIKDGSIVNLTVRAAEQEAILAAQEDREPDAILEEEVPEEVTSEEVRTPRVPGRVRRG